MINNNNFNLSTRSLNLQKQAKFINTKIQQKTKLFRNLEFISISNR